MAFFFFFSWHSLNSVFVFTICYIWCINFKVAFKNPAVFQNYFMLPKEYEQQILVINLEID